MISERSLSRTTSSQCSGVVADDVDDGLWVAHPIDHALPLIVKSPPTTNVQAGSSVPVEQSPHLHIQEVKGANKMQGEFTL